MRESTFQSYKKRVLRVLVHIQQNLDADLRLEELARLAHFSPYHFHRVFRGMVGESLGEHIRRLRLERSAFRLKKSRVPVTIIAFEAGYETHESFIRAFRGAFGEAPSRFRSSQRTGVCAAAPSGVHYDPAGRVKDFRSRRSGGWRMKVEIRHVEPMRVAFMRHVGPYSQCGATWGRFMAWAGSNGLLGPAALFIGICHDDPDVTPSERIRYDACVTVGEDFEPQGEVGIQTIPGGEYAVTTHEGPYDTLGETYARLCGEWAPRSGREFRSAPCFEVYLNDPESEAPEDLLTDVYVPLEPL